MEMFTTMITPYLRDGRVDIGTALKYVDWYYENGLDGIFAVCQSSEIFYLSLEERVELNRAVYARAKELEEKEYTASSGGGMVKVTVSGKKEVTKVEIDPEAVDPEDVEMLQDLILAAVNGALKLCDDRTSEAMNKLQGGMGGFPGLF